jgi:transposase, IS30 family
VIKLSKYKHLSLEEREKLYGMLERGFSHRKIAKKLNRSQSSISREIKRNQRCGPGYLPCYAQRRYERIAAKQRYKAPLKGPETLLFVRKHLRHPHYWTPEIIAGKLKTSTNGRLTITPECIYQYIYSKKARRDKLWQYLPSSRRKRRKQGGRKSINRGKAPNAVNIAKRPKYIQKRIQLGHWETDLMEGPRYSKPALSVSLERSTRMVVLTMVKNKSMVLKTNAVVSRLINLPQALLKTMTFDNGTENFDHQTIAEKLNVKTFFCNPYTSQEKGSVERKIKDIRRFIPKGTPLTDVSEHQIKQIEYWLNNKPMKCLGYLSPYEKMQLEFSKLN